MKKYLIILERVFRKNKFQLICFTLIMLISSLFLNLGLTIALNFDRTFDEKWTEAKMPDAFFVTPNFNYPKSIKDKILNLKSLKDYEERDCYRLNGTFSAGTGNGVAMPVVIYNRDDGHKYNQFKIFQKKDNDAYNAIYVSYWLYSDKGCRLGDSFSYKIGDITYNFVISGFVEDMQLGNNNCGGLALHLSKHAYDTFAKKIPDIYKSKSINLITDSKYNSEKIYQDAYKIITDKENSDSALSSGYYQQNIKFRTMMTDVLAYMIIFFALLITILSLFICGFRIRNSIDEDMQVIGILKSVGFKSNQVRLCVSAPYVFISLIASLIGCVGSFAVIPVFSALVERLTGLIYGQRPDPLCVTITASVILLTVVVTVFLSTKKVKKYPPVVALESGIEHHNFKHNFVELEKTRLSVNSALGAKNFVGSLKQNISLFFIMIFLTFMVNYVGSAYYNINIHLQNFMYSVGEEYCNVIAETNGNAEQLSKELENKKGIKKTLCFDDASFGFDNKKVKAFVAGDYSKQDNDLIYNGRDPKHNNEIALGCAFENDYKIGDTVSLTYGDKKKDYLVVGFLQAPDFMGKVIEMTTDGLKSFSSEYKPSCLYIYLDGTMKADECCTMLKNDYGKIVLNTLNNDKTIETSLGTYFNMTATLTIITVIVDVVLTALVLFIIFSTLLIQRRKDFGVLKALGFTTRQLTLQTVLGVFPSLFFGIAGGCAIGFLFMNDFWKLQLSTLEIRKCNINLPLPETILLGLTLLLISLLISVTLCRGLKKISAVNLVTE